MKGYRPLKQSKKAKNRMALIVPREVILKQVGKNWYKKVEVRK